MLGLRPTLKARPSLLDLVRRNNIESLSRSPSRLSHLTQLHPAEVPLPASPRLTPQTEVAAPIPTPLQELKQPVSKEDTTMAPVGYIVDVAVML